MGTGGRVVSSEKIGRSKNHLVKPDVLTTKPSPAHPSPRTPMMSPEKLAKIPDLDALHAQQIKGGVELDCNRAIRITVPILKAIRRYHQHEVIGLQNIPQSGPVLVVVNHSLATYDIFLLLHAIYEDLGRLPRPLADRLFFRLPLIGDLIRLYGAVQGSPQAARELLRAGELITVAPGGMREALRPSSQRYKILWEERKGFVRLAMATKSPIVLAACPKADDLYHIYPSHLTAWFYKSYKIPFFFAKGWKATAIPQPVKLTHYLSDPIVPPSVPKSPSAAEKVVDGFHRELVQRMQMLMDQTMES